MSVPSSASISTLPTSRIATQHPKQDTVSAIMMDESDPEDVGQSDRHDVDYFDSSSELSDNRTSHLSPAKRRRIRTPSDDDSFGSSRSRSVIEVTDDDSEDESSRYKPRPKRGAARGSKEAEMDIGTDNASDSTDVIDLDEDSDDEVEILDDREGPTSNGEVPVVHFSETTSRPQNAPVKGHKFTPADLEHKGRGPKARPRIATLESQDDVSPPGKRARRSQVSRKQFWQSKSGVEPGSKRSGREVDEQGQFEVQWQADLQKARSDAMSNDAVAANEDYIPL
ncbi:hypothetical protein QFC19_005516 [Naganishia cerealis]|uniref:Uncharacterized protein n=1 Tax=Naganishia cerealis TaxID=610337 RepID=A0ACC2VNB3_9TREE|nr:hypothetical protein QFC19_005516 [Naganishia cerealis]